jgi:hypothetical protein
MLSQRTLLTLATLHAIRRFRMQFALKGILLPFAVAVKAVIDPFASCRKELGYHMQYSFLHAVANPFWQAANKFDTY